MRLAISSETKELLEAFDRLGPAIDPLVIAAAFETGHAIAAEAGRRHQRRTVPTAEEAARRRVGSTASSFVVALSGKAVTVRANTDPGNLDIWLEFGTKDTDPAPFMLAAARLEEDPHRRRIEDAVARALAETFGS